MSDVKAAIMDAAERRMQQGGFGGFSFREIAADVGIKSSSVHYPLPNKEDSRGGRHSSVGGIYLPN